MKSASEEKKHDSYLFARVEYAVRLPQEVALQKRKDLRKHLLRVIPGLSLEKKANRKMSVRYYDSRSRALSRAGIIVRLRMPQDGAGILTIKGRGPTEASLPDIPFASAERDVSPSRDYFSIAKNYPAPESCTKNAAECSGEVVLEHLFRKEPDLISLFRSSLGSEPLYGTPVVKAREYEGEFADLSIELNRWKVDGERLAEISWRLSEQESSTHQELLGLLREASLVASHQQTKTSWALGFLSENEPR